MGLQPVECVLPELRQLFNPTADRGQAPSVDAVEPPPARRAPCDEAGAVQHAQVLRDGSEGHWDMAGEFLHAALAAGQQLEGAAPVRIGERLEDVACISRTCTRASHIEVFT